MFALRDGSAPRPGGAISRFIFAVVLMWGCTTTGDADERAERLREDLVLGGDSGVGLEAFESVGDVMETRDGSIIVVDASAADVRLFSRYGGHIRRIGRRGNGPGEFGYPVAVVEDDGLLAVLDVALRRLTWFRLDGTVVRTLAVDYSTIGHGIPSRVLGYNDPLLLLETTSGCVVARPSREAPPIFADPTVDGRRRLLAVSTVDGSIQVLSDVKDASVVPLYRDGGCTVVAAPFAGVTKAAIHGSSAITLELGERLVRRPLENVDGNLKLALNGTPLSFRRLGVRRVTAEDRDAFRGAVLQPPGLTIVESDRTWRLAALEELEIPSEVPPLDDILASTAAGVWVRRGTSPADSVVTWIRLGSELHRGRAVHLPSSVRVLRVSERALYGVSRGAFGAPVVHRFPIQ